MCAAVSPTTVGLLIRHYLSGRLQSDFESRKEFLDSFHPLVTAIFATSV